MSNPPNPLSIFSTYSYHHILIACNGTEAAEELSRKTELTVFQHDRESEKYSAKTINENEELKYITIIDGTTDSQFYIKNASWETWLYQNTTLSIGDIPSSTSISLDGTLNIEEPLGIRFLNILVNVATELEVDPVGLVFVLKTIFVGHKEDGGTELISTVRPYIFIITDINAVFDSSGAKYTISTMGITNGASKLPHIQKIFEGFNVKYNSTIKNTIEELNAHIKNVYQKHKLSFIQDLVKTKGITVAEARQIVENEYIDVEYEFRAKDYEDEKYVIGDVENDRTANIKNDGVYNFGPDIGIEEILNRIMASSSAVLQESKQKGQKYSYKIVSTIQSNSTKFKVIYEIKKYKMALNPYESQYVDGQIEPLPGQFIEFDYIFTGKNVDIKEFSMKMEMGMAFFQMAGTSDSLDAKTNEQVLLKSPAPARVRKEKRPKTPLFLGTTIKNKLMRNTKNPIDSATFQSLINRQASLEALGASLVIYGNPQLLDEMAILPSEISEGKTEEPKEEETVNPKWMTSPTLVKINIRMPKNPNDISTEYDTFWYTGYYNLLNVKHVFSDGLFTQELLVFSIPVLDELENKSDDLEKETKTKQKETFITDIFDAFGS